MDERAQEILLEQWRRRLFAVALAELPGRYSDAQDALAAAFVRIVAHRTQLRDESAFGAWARQIVRREARRLAPCRTESLEETVDSASEPNLALRLDMQRALEALPVGLAQTLRLYYEHGWSVAELAAALQVPEGTVKWRLSRGREELRTSLEGYKPMEKQRCVVVAPSWDASVRKERSALLYAAGWAEVRFAGSVLEAAEARSDAMVLEEQIGAHSAFELIPLLRSRTDSNARIWLLLREGRNAAEQGLAATSAYILGVDLLLSAPYTKDDFLAFAQRLRVTRP